MKASLKRNLTRLLHSELPVPSWLYPVIRGLYRSGVVLSEGVALLYKWLVVTPVVRAVCDQVGPGLRIERIPYIRGSGRIEIGEQVYMSGRIGIGLSSRSPGVTPLLHIGSYSFIGHQCSFNVRHGIHIGDHCLLAGGVVIQDHDGHPLDPARRRAGEPAPEEAVHRVCIGDGAWIGRRSMILKGVTIGENAVVGAGSLVVRDVPANSLVAGSPARLIRYLDEDEDRGRWLEEPGQKGTERHGQG